VNGEGRSARLTGTNKGSGLEKYRKRAQAALKEAEITRQVRMDPHTEREKPEVSFPQQKLQERKGQLPSQGRWSALGPSHYGEDRVVTVI
jgi:hypothetical protein